MQEKSGDISLRQKLFLAFIVPALIFLSLETVCRIFKIDQRLSPLSQDIKLEMPTWTLKDQNTSSRAANITGNRNTIDWLSMFEEGPGFRVRLIPNIEKSVTNTFSQIDADRAQKYFVKANSIGFRGNDLSAKKDPDVFRILVFGDSSSFGWGVNQNESFSALLPQLLSKIDATRFRKVEVGNFAIPGDSSEYGRLILEHFIPPFESDLVILGFGANDAKKVPVPHTVQVDSFRSKKTLQSVRYIASYSALFRSLDEIVGKIKSKANAPARRKKNLSAVNRKRYVENLSAMTNRALENKVGAVFILNLCTPADYAKQARQLAQKLNVQYLNGQASLLQKIDDIKVGKIHPQLVKEMTNSYPQDLKQNSAFYVTSDSCHPNKLGHLLVAEELAQLIATK